MQMQFIRVGVREFCEPLDGRGETCVLRIVQLCESRDYRVIEFIRGEPSEIWWKFEREHEVGEEKKLADSKRWKDKCARRPLTVGR